MLSKIILGSQSSSRRAILVEMGFSEMTIIPADIDELEIGREKSEELPYLVIMPDGNLYSTWMGKENRIDSLRDLLEVGNG